MSQQDNALSGGAEAKAGSVEAGNAGVPDERAELAAARLEIGRLRQAVAAAEAREGRLVRELQHRVRNMLAVIRSIVRRTRESGASEDAFAEHFEGRLDAVGRYQSHVDDVNLPGVELEDMLRNELLEACCHDDDTCSLTGPPVHLRQKAAEMMGLVIHELATNSIKFGSLAHDGGRLRVEWSLGSHADQEVLQFRWAEAGVPPITVAPRRSGFGQQLIEEALPYELGAETSFTLKPGGFECTIALPLPDDKDEQSGASLNNKE